MKPWKRIEPTKVQKVGWRTITSKTFILPDGRVETYDTHEREDTHFVVTVALTPEHEVITAYQFRTGPEIMMYELPGGGVEPYDNGDYMAAAARELREETGYVPGKMLHLGDTYKDSFSNGTWHVYYATDCTLHPDGQKLDDTEHIEVQLLSIDQLFAKARQGLVSDAQGVFLAYERLRAIQEPTAAA